MSSAINATKPSLTPASFTNRTIFYSHWQQSGWFSSEQEHRFLVLTKFNLLQLLVYQIIQAINQILCRCKHNAITCCICFYWINSAQVSLKSLGLSPSFVCTKQNTFFSSILAKLMDIYIRTHTHIGREKQGLVGQRKVACIHMKAYIITAKLEGLKKEIIIQEFKKHRPHHLSA